MNDKVNLSTNMRTIKQQRHPQETRDEAIKRANSGTPFKEIALSLNVSYDTIKRWHEESRGISRKIPARYTKELIEEVVRRIQSGESKSAVSRALKIDSAAVLKWTRHLGKTLTRCSPEMKKKALEMIADGKTLSEISRIVGVSVSAVSKWNIRITGKERQVHKAYTASTKIKVIEMLSTGSSTGDVEHELGVSIGTAAGWFRDALKEGKAKRPEASLRHADLNLGWVAKEYPQLEEWRLLAVDWLHGEVKNLGKKLRGMVCFFELYLANQKLPTNPKALLTRGAVLPNFYKVACGVGSSGVTDNNVVSSFLDWVLLHHFSDRSDDGAPIVSPAFCNPVPRCTTFGQPKLAESAYSPLPYGYISELRIMIAQGPNFADWVWAQNAIGQRQREGVDGYSQTWFEVTEDKIDKNDPDCVWRRRTFLTDKNKSVLEMWSPVRWVALLLKLQLPLRTFQVRMLDSGEADTWRYISGEWEINKGPLAQGTTKRPLRQGIFRRVHNPEVCSVSTKFYINTNKTADTLKSSGENGYDFPWPVMPNLQNQPHYWLEKLRNWQEKYNPIKRRTSWTELKPKHLNNKKSLVQLSGYPDSCFLFRAPEIKKYADETHLPITDGCLEVAWYKLLEALQHKLEAANIKNANGSQIQLVDSKSFTTTFFPLHSLRVSLITSLAIDGGLPFHTLVKLAGHSRLIMTLYYTKPGDKYMQDALLGAAERLEAGKEESIVSFLVNTEHKLLLKQAIANSPKALSSIIAENPANRNPVGWMAMHHGMCLVGGNTTEDESSIRIGGCYNGGTSITERVNGPVLGGARNCVRCRWFVTEPRYVPALAAHLGNICFHFDEARNAAIAQDSIVQNLKKQKVSSETNNLPFMKTSELMAAERLWESSMKRFSDLAEDMAACWQLIQRCNSLPPERDDTSTSLIAAGSVMDVHAVFEEVDSELLQLAGVCQNVEIYPDLDPGKAVFRRSQLLDAALTRENLPPVFMCLSEDEQLKAGNAFMRRLAQQANTNSLLGIRQVCKLVDAGESLAKFIGVDVKEILLESTCEIRTPILWRINNIE